MLPRKLFSCFALVQLFLALAFPRAYSNEKLIILIIVLFLLVSSLISRSIVLKGKVFFLFFFSIAALHLFPAIVAIFYGNNDEYIYDGIRLYMVFPLIFSLLYSALVNFEYKYYVENLIKLSAVFIFAINAISIIQDVYTINFLPASFIEANNLRVGIHDGYLQLTSHNIGSLFFITGYLIHNSFYSHKKTSFTDWVVLLMVLLCVLASGRRAMWFALLLAPVLVVFTAIIFNSNVIRNKQLLKYIISFYSVVGVVLIFTITQYFNIDDFLTRASGAFSDDGGKRGVQTGLMLNFLYQNPLFGSGFGGAIIDGGDTFHVFEITYVQMLFNNGILITCAILLVIMISFCGIYNKSHNAYTSDVQVQSLFCGLMMLFIGSSTNPYLGSFDFLIFVGVIPLSIYSLKRG